ncbi:MAG TPA: sigma-54 dependent transcriptional regulator [Thermoanaerobaculia bacterium]|nr:sigma-54 dependent transcriptional regulator [Thermoanaerobaculia bacterium]
MVRIAIIDDEESVRVVLARILRTAGFDAEVFASGDEFLRRGGGGGFDVVLTDFQMEGASGLDVLKTCRGEDDPAEVLLVTGHGSVRNAVDAMKLGAFDYLTKPVEPKELLHRVGLAAEAKRLKREVGALSGEVRRRHGSEPPTAESKAMRECLAHARKAAASSSTVLILGETGSGKDVVARFIQASGPRADRPYLTINCAALPETLVESELFGHARGAFSGANTTKRGLFEEANGGTLFLDEIGSVPPPVQAKLLRVLEEGIVRRVGENQPIALDVRIIATTNRDLVKAIASGEFRDDLYYRLSVVTLTVPPLRERREDIEPLARRFLAESVRRLGKLRVFAPETLDVFRSYAFPGNIRELRYAIEQAAVLSEQATLLPADFPFDRRSPMAPPGPQPRRAGQLKNEITPERLEAALAAEGGNRVRAARALGISRATLYRLLDHGRVQAAKGPE